MIHGSFFQDSMMTSTQALSNYGQDMWRRSTQKLIDKWQGLLKLGNWRYLLVDMAPVSSKSVMECAINRKRRIATIRVATRSWQNLDSEEYERNVIHEVLHPLLDPLREEFDFMLKSLPADRVEEYKERHDLEVERIVEHLSQVLYDLQFRPE